MTGRHGRLPDRWARLLATLGIVLGVAAITTGLRVGWQHAMLASAPRPAVLPVVAAGAVRVTAPAPAGAVTGTVARPVSVSIPAIGVNSTLVPLHVDRAGVLQPPADDDHAGWYVGGPTPGDPGPAVIAGHVDSRSGPAIFFRLRDLHDGDTVLVTRSDGALARFQVVEVQRYPKDAFPTARVYGPTPDRALRLITCGGSFDYSRRSYRDNVVVYAVAV